MRARHLVDLELLTAEPEPLLHDRQLPMSDRRGQAGDDGAGAAAPDLRPLEERERTQARRRIDVDLDRTATRGGKSPTYEPRLHARAHAIHEAQERALEEIEGRGQRVVRAALDADAAGRGRGEERRKDRLQHKRSA